MAKIGAAAAQVPTRHRLPGRRRRAVLPASGSPRARTAPYWTLSSSASLGGPALGRRLRRLPRQVAAVWRMCHRALPGDMAHLRRRGTSAVQAQERRPAHRFACLHPGALQVGVRHLEPIICGERGARGGARHRASWASRTSAVIKNDVALMQRKAGGYQRPRRVARTSACCPMMSQDDVTDRFGPISPAIDPGPSPPVALADRLIRISIWWEKRLDSLQRDRVDPGGGGGVRPNSSVSRSPVDYARRWPGPRARAC